MVQHIAIFLAGAGASGCVQGFKIENEAPW
jgi:hypothetical protein